MAIAAAPSQTILRAYRVRLEPTVEQRKHLARSVGVARAAYNWTLAEWRRQYRLYQLASRAPGRVLTLLAQWRSPLLDDPRWTDPALNKKPTAFAIHRKLTRLKHVEMPWMTAVSSLVVREAVLDVGRAHEHFVRRLRSGSVGRAAGEPRFRARQRSRSYHIDQGDAISVRDDAIRLPIVGWIKVHPHQRGYIPTAARVCGVGIREHLGHWYAAVRVEVPHGHRLKRPLVVGKQIAVEPGANSLLVTSDGQRVLPLDDSRQSQSAQRRLALWCRRLSRRYQPGAATQSAGWLEARHHVQRLHAEIARTRDELLHHGSNRVLDSHAETIVFRDSDTAKRDGAPGPELADNGSYELRRKLEYKQRWRGGEVVLAPAVVGDDSCPSPSAAVVVSEPLQPMQEDDRTRRRAVVAEDYRPPSGAPVGGGGTHRRKTGRKSGATAERTGKVMSDAQAPPMAPDGAATSPPGSGKGAREL